MTTTAVSQQRAWLRWLLRASRADLKKFTPPGWKRIMVLPPWPISGGPCRSCRRKASLVPALARRDHDRKIVYYTFVVVCPACWGDATRMHKLCDRAFKAVVPSGS